jgi:hypothetical protein
MRHKTIFIRIALLWLLAMPLLGFVRKKKRGALLHGSATASFSGICRQRYFAYLQNGSSKILASSLRFADGQFAYSPKPFLLMPEYPKNSTRYFQYFNVDALNPRKEFPDMILNRPVPFNINFLKNTILKFGVNVPL